MKKEKLKRIKEAPEQGYIMAYTKTEAIFKPYYSLETDLPDEDYLEIHLFDGQKEYRAISSTSKRYAGLDGIIETVVSDQLMGEDCCTYQQEYEMIGNCPVKVCHYYDFDENGTAYLKNYRMSSGGK